MYIACYCCSVAKSCPSLQAQGLQQTRLLWPPVSPGACSSSCPLNPPSHPTISSSVVPFYSCPQSFPASGSFPVSHLFTSNDQSIGISASASVLSMNSQGWFPLGLTALFSLLPKGFSRVFPSITAQKHEFLVLSLHYGPTLTTIHDYWKNQIFD